MSDHDMDERMLNAAWSGDVSMLHQLLQENPFILSDHSHMNISKETPLTIAIKANHPTFIREILKSNTQMAIELNRDGFSPLDLASAYGSVEIVIDLLEAVGPEICKNPGRDGRTALHYAAMNGRVEIIDVLLSVCPDSAKDVTAFGETALHLAVKCFRFEALRCMLQWLEKSDDLKEVVNWGDKLGNTVLHYAASRKQLESVELLLEWNNRAGNEVNQNALNKKGLTALDIAEILTDSSSSDHLQLMREIMHHPRGSTASSTISPPDQIDIVLDTIQSAPNNKTPQKENHDRLHPKEKPKKFRDMVELFQFQWERDSISEARSTLLIVVALIATVTFQAGINTPHFVEVEPKSSRSFPKMLFLVLDTMAFSTSVAILDYLAGGLPFQRELRISMCTMGGAYACAIVNIKPPGGINVVWLLTALLLPYILRLLSCVRRAKRKPGSKETVTVASASRGTGSGRVRTRGLADTNGGATAGFFGSLDPNQF